jgi:hypothetical protein
MSSSVWIINLVLFGVLMEADLGRRKIGWFRVARPLLAAMAVVAYYLTAVPTGGNNLVLQAVGAGVGVLLGAACHLFVSVRYDPTRGKSGAPVSRAGFGYAAFWAVIFAARLGFVYGSEHVFARSLGHFLVAHQLSGTALTNALLFSALALGLARSAVLAGRGVAARGHRSAYQLAEVQA